jgi:hypothetical protein
MPVIPECLSRFREPNPGGDAMNNKVIFGVIIIGLCHHIGSRLKKLRPPFLSRNPQYAGIRLPGTKHIR